MYYVGFELIVSLSLRSPIRGVDHDQVFFLFLSIYLFLDRIKPLGRVSLGLHEHSVLFFFLTPLIAKSKVIVNVCAFIVCLNKRPIVSFSDLSKTSQTFISINTLAKKYKLKSQKTKVYMLHVLMSELNFKQRTQGMWG